MFSKLKQLLLIFNECCSSLFKNRALLIELTKRDLSDQYAGQMLGLFWIICHPLFLIGTYIFIFGVIFKTKIGGTYDLPYDYTTYILSGLIPWLTFQQSLVKTSSSLTGQANLVQQVIFPIEILPAKTVAATFLTQVISLSLIFIYVIIKYLWLPKIYCLLPILLIFQVMSMLGLGFILAIITPFLKDIKDLITLYSVIGIYFIPVVYLPNWLPTLFKPLIYLNPFSYMIWCFQDVLYFGRFQHPIAWAIFPLLSVILFSVGFKIFKRIQIYVGNVL